MAKCRIYLCNIRQPLGEPNSCGSLKGISPSICMHKILLNDDSKTSVEHQRRLNPMMKDVVRKEVLKWLNAGFIYAISDSP